MMDVCVGVSQHMRGRGMSLHMHRCMLSVSHIYLCIAMHLHVLMCIRTLVYMLLHGQLCGKTYTLIQL